MSQKLNPFSGRQFLDANGDPYSGAKLFVYEAGTSTKYTVTKDLAGTSNHANPIILNSRGEPADGAGAAQAIWQGDGQAVKLVLAPSDDSDPPASSYATWDNISGINDSVVSGGASQWVTGTAPTYVSATSFTLVGDQSSTYHVGRRIKTTNSSGDVYSVVASVSYSTVTTVTLINDSGSLDSGLSAVYYGLLTATNNSLPGEVRHGNVKWVKGSDIASASSLTIPKSGNYFDVTGTTTITGISTVGIGAFVKLHFDSSLSLTHHATDFVLLGGEDIDISAGDELEFFEYDTGKWRQTIDPGLPRITLNEGQVVAKQQDNTGYEAWCPRNHISGLVMSNNATDSDHDIDVSIGEAADSDNDHVLKLTAATTVEIDAALGVGNGGLSSSLTVANNTWYHYFIIKTGTGACTIGIDTSVSAANLVTDHSITQYRRIGSALTDGSANIIGFQSYETAGGGLEMLWDNPPLDVSTTAQSATAIARTLSVPSDVSVTAFMNAVVGDSDDINLANVYIRTPAVDDEAPSLSTAPLATITSTAATSDAALRVHVRTNTSSQVETRADAASIDVYISTLGWQESRI